MMIRRMKMRLKKFFITDKNSEFVSYNKWSSSGSNASDVTKMKKIMKRAINYELTPKQRYCLCEHYLKGRSMKSIAAELGINPSTVTRHIQNALSRLQRVASYYEK